MYAKCTLTCLLQEIYDYLKTVCSDVHITKGDFDENPKYPDEEVYTLAQLGWQRICLLEHCCSATLSLLQILEIGDFKVGLCHGHQVSMRSSQSLHVSHAQWKAITANATSLR